jgi:branched-subunit amino acid transport protein
VSTPGTWLIIGLIGLGTFALRLSFIELIDRFALPAVMRRGLRFVPPAVLAALVIPALVHGGAEGGEFHNPRLLAGLMAGIVAWYTRSVVWTLCAGMGTIWVLVWLGMSG